MKANLITPTLHPQEPPVEEQMLRALELLHYGNRFRDELFVVAVPKGMRIGDLALDLRLLHAAQIWVLLVVEPDETTEHDVEQLSKRGLSLTFLSTLSMVEHRDVVQEDLALGHMPVIPVHPLPGPAPEFPEQQLWKTASYWGSKLQARKVFYLSEYRGIEIQGKLAYQLTPGEIERLVASEEDTNVGSKRLNFLLEENITSGMSLTLVEAKAGRLFLEVFTHRGKGTLVTKHYPDEIRRGRLGDVTELSLLMRPSILAGLLLPTSDDEIAANISSYFIYTVNDALVACARLIDYGNTAELAKFSTLPRYQGKGRARDLTKRMIEEARIRGKDYVFALSVSPKMWEFFLSLGFSEASRETLPEAWKNGYDFSRPSKAFRLDLKSSNVIPFS